VSALLDALSPSAVDVEIRSLVSPLASNLFEGGEEREEAGAGCPLSSMLAYLIHSLRGGRRFDVVVAHTNHTLTLHYAALRAPRFGASLRALRAAYEEKASLLGGLLNSAVGRIAFILGH